MWKRIAMGTALLGCVACAERSDREPQFVPASAPAQPSARSGDYGVKQLSRYFCDRELECGRIGVGQRYANQEGCLDDRQEADVSLFGPSICRAGLNTDQLSLCLSSIRLAECDFDLKTTESLPDCTREKLCVR